MTILNLFITLPELNEMISWLAEQYDLQAAGFFAQRHDWIDSEKKSYLGKRHIDHVNLYPAKDVPKVKNDYDRLINQASVIIYPGSLKNKNGQSVLFMSQIQSAFYGPLRRKTQSWLARLKTLSPVVLKYGTAGEDKVTGKKLKEPATGYSPEALKLYKKGALWMKAGMDAVAWQPR